MSDTFQITIQGFSPQLFADELITINHTTSAFLLVQIPERKLEGFTITPEAMTILVTGVNSLVVLINSILIFLAQRKTGIVRIVSASGQTLEFPKDTPPEKVEHYLEILDKLDVRQIIVKAKN